MVWKILFTSFHNLEDAIQVRLQYASTILQMDSMIGIYPLLLNWQFCGGIFIINKTLLNVPDAEFWKRLMGQEPLNLIGLAQRWGKRNR